MLFQRAISRRPGVAADHANYKWWALSCTSLGMLLATINSGTLIIALPDLERSLGTSLLQLVWVILAYMISSTVLVLTAGRLSDLFGRKKAYVGGFVVFALASLGAGFAANGTELILWRIVQGVGGAFLFANSSAILTDAFPQNERGKAMGINGIAAVSGSFLGLLLGGVLAPIEWHLVFLVSVPFGVFGTVWAYLKLRDNGVRIQAKIDWLGNALFAIGLIAVLVGIVYSLLPYGGHPTGWTNPWVLTGVFGGIALGFAPAAGLPNLVPNSTLSFVADHKIETPRGTLSMRGSGVFDTARGEYSEVDPITGGTGIFAGATGTLWLTGTSPDGGASFAGPLFGQVCLSR